MVIRKQPNSESATGPSSIRMSTDCTSGVRASRGTLLGGRPYPQIAKPFHLLQDIGPEAGLANAGLLPSSTTPKG